MKILAADASTKVISVALLDNDKVAAKIHKQYPRSQGSLLTGIIKQMLEGINQDIKAIDLFCVGLGPGSFTGLRVSVASMRSLSIALEKPIIGIPSFDAIAHNLIKNPKSEIQNPNIGVLFDAKQNKVYARFYRKKNNAIEPITDFLLDGVEAILNKIESPTIIAGDAIEIYSDKILEVAGKNAIFIKEDLWYPNADILARLAQDRYSKGYRDDPFKLLPLYIYPRECQIKLQNSK